MYKQIVLWSQNRMLDLLELKLRDGCEPPDLGSGNWTLQGLQVKMLHMCFFVWNTFHLILLLFPVIIFMTDKTSLYMNTEFPLSIHL